MLVLRHVDEEIVVRGDDEQLEQDLSLRGEQARMDGATILELADVVGQHPLQEFPRVGARHSEDRAIGEERRLAMAHHLSFCYQGVPKL